MDFVFQRKGIIIKTLSILALFFLWESSAFILKSPVFPAITEIISTLFVELIEGELIFHLLITLYRVFISFLFAMLIGTFLGILMGNNKKINLFLDGWNELVLNFMSSFSFLIFPLFYHIPLLLIL